MNLLEMIKKYANDNNLHLNSKITNKNDLLDKIRDCGFEISDDCYFSTVAELIVHLKSNEFNYELFHKMYISHTIKLDEKTFDEIKKIVVKKLPRKSKKNYRVVISKQMHKIARSHFIIGMVEKLLGKDTKLWNIELLVKPAYGGKKLGWHNDYYFWNQSTLAGEMIQNREVLSVVSVWIPLVNVDEKNASLRVVPYEEFIKEEKPFYKGIHLNMTVGECILFNEFLIHSSDANESPHDRPILILRFTKQSTKVLFKKPGFNHGK